MADQVLVKHQLDLLNNKGRLQARFNSFLELGYNCKGPCFLFCLLLYFHKWARGKSMLDNRVYEETKKIASHYVEISTDLNKKVSDPDVTQAYLGTKGYQYIRILGTAIDKSNVMDALEMLRFKDNFYSRLFIINFQQHPDEPIFKTHYVLCKKTRNGYRVYDSHWPDGSRKYKWGGYGEFDQWGADLKDFFTDGAPYSFSIVHVRKTSDIQYYLGGFPRNAAHNLRRLV
ncbi:hypothetical protein ACFL96_03445 [Thermoproteota archaeon]